VRKGVKVRRVVRRVELWSVAKVAFFFHTFCYLLTLGALVGCWFAADRLGTLDNIEKLVSRLGWEEFTIHGDVLLRSAALIGASLVVVATIATVAMAFFYNLLSGILGGVVMSVLQEHVPEGGPQSRRQRRRMRRVARKQERFHRSLGRRRRLGLRRRARRGRRGPAVAPSGLADPSGAADATLSSADGAGLATGEATGDAAAWSGGRSAGDRPDGLPSSPWAEPDLSDDEGVGTLWFEAPETTSTR
jgi:Transmembrane domain of unknown function (DUF3566)